MIAVTTIVAAAVIAPAAASVRRRTAPVVTAAHRATMAIARQMVKPARTRHARLARAMLMAKDGLHAMETSATAHTVRLVPTIIVPTTALPALATRVRTRARMAIATGRSVANMLRARLTAPARLSARTTATSAGMKVRVTSRASAFWRLVPQGLPANAAITTSTVATTGTATAP